MAISRDGFYRPRVVEEPDATEWETIRRICPGVRVDAALEDSEAVDTTWGSVQSVRVGHAVDERVRWLGASGGALTAVLVHLLESGLVEAVIHVGQDIRAGLAATVTVSRSREEVIRHAGSRYVPSAPIAGLRTALASHDSLAFVGKPCDISALRQLSNIDSAVRDRVKYMLSFFCAGVPSVAGTRAMLRRLQVREEDVRSISYRGQGWPGRATAFLKDGTRRELSYEVAWGHVLNKFLQTRCKLCADGLGFSADIVFGDAWAVEGGKPSFTERPGLSTIITRTHRGEALVRDCIERHVIEATAAELEYVRQSQPHQVRRKRQVWARLTALRLFGRPVPEYRGFPLWQMARRGGVLENVAAFLGTIRRVAQGRLRDGNG